MRINTPDTINAVLHDIKNANRIQRIRNGIFHVMPLYSLLIGSPSITMTAHLLRGLCMSFEAKRLSEALVHGSCRHKTAQLAQKRSLPLRGMAHAPAAERRADDRVSDAIRFGSVNNVLGNYACYEVALGVICGDWVACLRGISVEACLGECGFDERHTDSKLAYFMIQRLGHSLYGMLGG